MKNETLPRRHCGCSGTGALTRTELLMTVAVVAVLGGLLALFLGGGKGSAGQAVCRANLKQLGAAFVLYCRDNGDAFPARGSAHDFGPQPEDWIYWQRARDFGGARDLKESCVAKYISDVATNSFRCPDDDVWNMRRYPYSYSFRIVCEHMVVLTEW